MDVMGKISPQTAAASPASSWHCRTCSKLHPTELHSIKENISCYSGAPLMGQILRTALSTCMHQVSDFPAAAKAHVCPLTASQAPTGQGLSRAKRYGSRFRWRLWAEDKSLGYALAPSSSTTRFILDPCVMLVAGALLRSRALLCLDWLSRRWRLPWWDSCSLSRGMLPYTGRSSMPLWLEGVILW